MEEWFGMECLEIFQCCVAFLRKKNAIKSFSEKILGSLRRFYLKKHYRDR